MTPARAVRDAGDVRVLLGALDVTTLDQVLDIVAHHFPDEPLSQRSQQLVEDILAERRE